MIRWLERKAIDPFFHFVLAVYMMHETQKCLLKTSRDFCLVAMDGEKVRVETGAGFKKTS